MSLTANINERNQEVLSLLETGRAALVAELKNAQEQREALSREYQEKLNVLNESVKEREIEIEGLKNKVAEVGESNSEPAQASKLLAGAVSIADKHVADARLEAGLIVAEARSEVEYLAHQIDLYKIQRDSLLSSLRDLLLSELTAIDSVQDQHDREKSEQTTGENGYDTYGNTTVDGESYSSLRGVFDDFDGEEIKAFEVEENSDLEDNEDYPLGDDEVVTHEASGSQILDNHLNDSIALHVDPNNKVEEVVSAVDEVGSFNVNLTETVNEDEEVNIDDLNNFFSRGEESPQGD